MGSFYVTLSVRSQNRAEVASLLHDRKAIVTGPVNGWVLVADEMADSQDIAVIESLSERMSRELGTDVFTVLNHDDDILMYWLYRGGHQLDTYNSNPDFFQVVEEPAPPLGGRAKILCAAFESAAIEEVQGILSHQNNGDESDPYLLETDRHRDLMQALGQPPFVVGFGYRYAARGDLPDGLEASDLKFITPAG